MNEIPYQIDQDFINLTKLVWHFCHFSTLFGGFMKFLQIRKRKMKFPPGTRLRGQPVAAAAHTDARTRPRHGQHKAALGGAPSRPWPRRRRASGPTGQPTRHGLGTGAHFAERPHAFLYSTQDPQAL